MICKFCKAEINDGLTVCPACGKNLSKAADEDFEIVLYDEEEEKEETAVEKEEKAEQPEEEKEEKAAEKPANRGKKAKKDKSAKKTHKVEKDEEDEDSEQEETDEEEDEDDDESSYAGFAYTEVEFVKPRSKVALVAGIIGAVLGLGVLAILLLTALGVEIKLPTNDIYRKEIYTVEDSTAIKKADTVVARAGDAELTNAQLQIYYRIQVVNFINNYYMYLSYIGFDYTQPLSTQMSYFDETMTWEQYFIQEAINTWHFYQSLALTAQDAGYTLPEERQAEIDAMPESLEAQAEENSFEDADAMVKASMGPACSVELYIAYVSNNILASNYYTSLQTLYIPTDAQVEAYFAENEDKIAEEHGIYRENDAVRHILITPAAEDPTEDDWAAARTKAEGILEEWKAGSATEDSFAAMVAVYSEDTGSVASGGLFDDITPGASYVENFKAWAVDEARQVGDTDIVETEYGYHIMYYVGSYETNWVDRVSQVMIDEHMDGIINQAKETYPLKVYYSRIALAEVKLS